MNAYFASLMLLIFSAMGVHLPDSAAAAETSRGASNGAVGNSDVGMLETASERISNMGLKAPHHLPLFPLIPDSIFSSSASSPLNDLAAGGIRRLIERSHVEGAP